MPGPTSAWSSPNAFGFVVHKALVFHQDKHALHHRLGCNSAQPPLRYLADSLTQRKQAVSVQLENI